MFDIDYFKKFNDSYGYQIGDQVFCFVVLFVKQNVKNFDIVCCYGGEEFVIILLNVSLDEVVEIFDKICNVVMLKELVKCFIGENFG